MGFFYRKYFALLGAFFIELAIGITFVWGALSPYFCDYFRKKQPINIKKSEFDLIFAFTTLGMFIGQNQSVSFVNKFGSRKSIFFMGTLYSGLIFASSLITNVIIFGILWTLLSIFAGCCFVAPIIICQKYFPENRGFVSGVVLSGYGFSSVIIQTLMIQIINPLNMTAQNIDGQLIYDLSIIDKVPEALQISSLLTMILITIGSFLLKNKKTLNQDQQFLASDLSNKTEKLIQNNDCQSVAEAQKTKAFYIIFSMYFLTELLEYCMQANYKSYGYENIQDDNFLGLVVGNLSNFGNGIWRLFYGFLYDKFGFKTAYNTLLLTNIILILTISLIAQNKILFSIWIMVILGNQGGLASLMVSFTVQIFGILKGGNIYARILLAQTFANFSQQFIVLGLRPYIGYLNIFYIFTGCNIIASLLNNLCPPIYERTIKNNEQNLIQETNITQISNNQQNEYDIDQKNIKVQENINFKY